MSFVSFFGVFLPGLFSVMLGCKGMFEVPQRNSNTPTSGDVKIEVAEETKNPRVFVNANPTVICRRGVPLDKDYGLTPLEVVTEGAQQTGGAAAGQNAGVEEDPGRVITKQVGAGWFRVGLNFANHSKYHLIIEDLKFTVTANWGDENLRSEKEISSGECGGSDTDYLYVIKPRAKTMYNPRKRSYINNLQLYVDGLQLPTKPSFAQGNTGGGAAAGGGGPGAANNQSEEDPFVLKSLPAYKVHVEALGQFVDKDRGYIANFTKEFHFRTSSRF